MESFETFRDIGYYEIHNLTQTEPSCFNGAVRVVKYRIIIERVAEPPSTIRERIQKLWDECDNHHHWTPLQKTGKKYGLDLKHK